MVTYQAPARGVTFSKSSAVKTHQVEAPTPMQATSTKLHPGLTALAYYDARAINGLDVANPADGTAISQWNDLSGNGLHLTQATGSKQPLFRSASKNLLTYNQATVESDTTGLQASSNASIARVTTPVKSGVGSLAVTATAAASMRATQQEALGHLSPCTPGNTYTVAAATRAATTPRSFYTRIRFWDAAGVQVGADANDPQVSNTSTGWTEHRTVRTAPAGASYVSVSVIFITPALNEIHYIDELGVWEGTSTTWIPPVTLPNNQPCVQFDGVDDVLNSANTAFQGSGGVTVYAVGCLNSTDYSDWQAVYSHRDGASKTDYLLYSLVTTGVMQGWASNVVNWTTDSANASAPAPQVYKVWTLINKSLSSELWENGSSNGATATASAWNADTASPSPIRVGAGGSNGTQYFLDGQVCSLYVYAGEHNAATRQAIQYSLGGLYGITVA